MVKMVGSAILTWLIFAIPTLGSAVWLVKSRNGRIHILIGSSTDLISSLSFGAKISGSAFWLGQNSLLLRSSRSRDLLPMSLHRNIVRAKNERIRFLIGSIDCCCRLSPKHVFLHGSAYFSYIVSCNNKKQFFVIVILKLPQFDMPPKTSGKAVKKAGKAAKSVPKGDKKACI